MLILLEDGEKLALRGDQWIDRYDPERGASHHQGEAVADEAFGDAPPELLAHARGVWAKYAIYPYAPDGSGL